MTSYPLSRRRPTWRQVRWVSVKLPVQLRQRLAADVFVFFRHSTPFCSRDVAVNAAVAAVAAVLPPANSLLQPVQLRHRARPRLTARLNLVVCRFESVYFWGISIFHDFYFAVELNEDDITYTLEDKHKTGPSNRSFAVASPPWWNMLPASLYLVKD